MKKLLVVAMLFAFAATTAVAADTLPPAFESSTLSPRLARRLELLRSRAPFGRLAWERIEELDSGEELRLRFRSPSAERVELWLKAESDGVHGGYRLEENTREVSAELEEGLTAMLHALGWLKRSAPQQPIEQL